MTATNHAMTGAIIGLTISQPWLALPVALLSHFVLDMIPHFGWPGEEQVKMESNLFRNYLIAEALICFWIVVILFTAFHGQWFVASVCAFLAASPDLVSANRYFTLRAGKPWKPSLYSRFASWIQWFERPIGGFVELAWATACIIILAKLA